MMCLLFLTCQPLRLPTTSVTDGVENQFHPAGNSQLIENAGEILFHRMFAELEFVSYFPITEPVGNQGDYLLFPRRQQLEPAGIHHPQGRHLGYDFDEVLQLLIVDPQLPLMNALDAFAKETEGIVGKAEEAFGARTEGAHHGITIRCLQQQYLRDLGMGQMQAANNRHLMPAIPGVIRVNNRNVDGAAGNGAENGIYIHGAGSYMKFRPAAERSDQELALHVVGIGDQHTDSRRSRDANRSHNTPGIAFTFIVGAAAIWFCDTST